MTVIIQFIKFKRIIFGSPNGYYQTNDTIVKMKNKRKKKKKKNQEDAQIDLTERTPKNEKRK